MPLMERMHCKLRLLMHRIHTRQISSLLASRVHCHATSASRTTIARANLNYDEDTILIAFNL